MSYHGRAVLRAIDQAHAVRERHPTLFAAQLRADRTCLQLARAMDRYRRRQPPGREEAYMGDREAERVDTDWEDKQAAKRAERWANPTPNAAEGALPHHRAETKPDLDRDRRSMRAGLDADDLYRLALERAARLSTVAAGNPEPSRGGGGSSAPPAQQRLEDDPRWERRWGVVKSGLLLVHDLLDEHEGLGARPTEETSEALNMLVLTEGRGLSCKEAAARFPEATGGRASVVARIRRNQGSGLDGLDESGKRVAERLDLLGYKVSVIDGEPVMDLAAANVRRVVIEAD